MVEHHLTNTTWELTSGIDCPVGVTPTMHVDGDTISGFAGCNRYFGSVEITIRGFRLTGPVGSTRMLCGPECMQLEAEFLARLDAARSWTRRGDELRLLDDADVELLGMRHVPNEVQ